jgi:hypothetical protein
MARFTTIRTCVLMCVCLAVWPQVGISAELKPDTVKAWEQYIVWIDARVTRELASPNSFLIQDRLAAAQKTKLVELLNAGKAYVDEVRGTVPANAKFGVPEGLIHHWWGSILVPQMTLKDLLKFLQDYDHHAGRFADVEASKLLSRQGDYFRFYLRLKRTKAFVTAYYNTIQECTYSIYDQKRASSRSIATRIAELDSPGTSDEREKAPGIDRGLLWDLASWWRFRETGAGVIVELESASLTRNIPALINLIPGVAGYIRATPREAMTSVLTSIRSYAGR